MITSTRHSTERQQDTYFQPRRLGHVNLVVGDLDASMRFYNEVVGLEEAYRVLAIQGGFLGNGNTHHDIGMVASAGPSGKGRPPGLNHLAFELETEVDLVQGYERAIADHVVFQRTLDHDIAHSAYCEDPDGNSCELYADVERDWRNARAGNVTKAKPIWKPGMTVPNTERNYDPDPAISRVDHAIFHPLRTKHATLVVKNLEESLRFYQEVVGLRLLVQHEQGAYALFGGTCGERNIAVVKASGDNAPGLHHFGLELRSEAELDASLSELSARGMQPERVVDHPLRRAVFLKDPDGLRVQLFIDKASDAQRWSEVDVELAQWVL